VFTGAKGDLWVTDGTADGTVDITANMISPFTHSSFHLDADYLTAFENEVVFGGADDRSTSNGAVYELWTLKPRGSPTEVLGVANEWASGLDPIYITSLGDKFVFVGINASGHKRQSKNAGN
jgi:hypothetical protein